MRDLSIYIHIPFCVRKCLYCDFLSFALPETTESIESYVNLLEQEILSEAEKYREHHVISVFFGGGTPSLLPPGAVTRIMEALRRCYHMTPDAEVTIEANPGTVTRDKLQEYITAGINRLSIGLQSADDKELARIGRIHDYQTFRETYVLAREAGFQNINIDLMSALPGQSVDSYRETLRRVAHFKPEHISAYSLILEEGTPLYERQGEYCFPTEEEDRGMYLLTESYLSSCGYHRYEISNYALEGYECRHNKVYWQRGDYAGFGLGAASMVQNVRWSNPAEIDKYEEKVCELALHPRCAERTSKRQILTKQEQMEEFMFLGLRMMCGVSRQEFCRQFGRKMEEVYGDVLEKMCRQGLLVCGEGHIKLTERGIDVSNYVMAEFLLDS